MTDRTTRLSRIRKIVSSPVSTARAKLGHGPGHEELVRRLTELEKDMQEQRELSLRVAQLTDIVQELLIPVADRDEEKLHRLLEKYAGTL